MSRISKDQYFLEMCDLVAKRSTCIRRKIGAVIVKDGHVVSTGYNGAPSKIPHCIDTGCIRTEQNIPSGQHHEIGVCTHAEQNAIIQCAYHGKSCKDATMYINLQPCIICSKIMINAGIKKIVFRGNYPDENSLNLLKEAKITLIQTD